MHLVSCLLLTYGRAPDYLHLLGEAVESFLRQEGDTPRELLILNDCPTQELVCEAPCVRVVNCQTRIKSLGEKYNLAVSLARGDILMPAEDDDISLPGRVAQAVWNIDAGCDYFNPGRTWYLDGEGLHHEHAHGYCHNASAYTRTAFALAGGYPSVSGCQDRDMNNHLRHCARTSAPLSHPSHWNYIYRWGVSPYHLSGHHDLERAWQNAPVGQPGRYVITPGWRQDYNALVQERLAQLGDAARVG